MNTSNQFLITPFFKNVSLPCQLDHVCLDQSSSALDDISATEPPKQKIQAILDLVKQCDKEGSVPTVESTSVLTAIHLIISSLDGERSHALHSL